MRYAIRFTNLDVLAGVVGGRDLAPVRAARALPAGARGALRRRRASATQHARPAGPRDGDPRRRRVGLDAGEGREAEPDRRGAGGRAHVPRSRARTAAGRADRVRRRAGGRRAADDRSRVSSGSRSRRSSGTRASAGRRSATRSPRPCGSGRRRSAGRTATSPPCVPRRRRARQTRGLVSILFLSDGAQTRGDLEPLEGADRRTAAAFRCTRSRSARRAARSTSGSAARAATSRSRTRPARAGACRSRRIPITLSAIADRTGGEFFAARSADSLQSAYKKLGSSLGRKPGKTEITYVFLAEPPDCCSSRDCSPRSGRRDFRDANTLGTQAATLAGCPRARTSVT